MHFNLKRVVTLTNLKKMILALLRLCARAFILSILVFVMFYAALFISLMLWGQKHKPDSVSEMVSDMLEEYPQE